MEIIFQENDTSISDENIGTELQELLEIRHPKTINPIEPVQSATSSENISNSDYINNIEQAFHNVDKASSIINDVVEISQPTNKQLGQINQAQSFIEDTLNIDDNTNTNDNTIMESKKEESPKNKKSMAKQLTGTAIAVGAGLLGGSTSDHLFNFFGYKIPVETLIFIFVLIIICSLLYYFSIENKPKTKSKSNENNVSNKETIKNPQ
jgi:hypothetical protein